MRKDITVAAEPRDSRGKNEARRLRARGLAPAVVYGAGGDPVPVSLNPKEIGRIMNSKTGHNTIFNLAIQAKETTPVMIADYQVHPFREVLLHVDLKRVDLAKRIQVRVPVHTTGEPKGVKIQGGLHEVITRDIEIECLPDDIPEEFSVSVAELMIGQNIRAGDVPLSGSMKLVSAADTVISHVVSLRAETPAAGTEAAAAGTAAEPEVIKKGKKEEEGAADKKPAGGEKKAAGGEKKAAGGEKKGGEAKKK